MITYTLILFSLVQQISGAGIALRENTSESTEMISEKMAKHDIRYGAFAWSATSSEKGVLVIDVERKSDDCKEKNYLERARRIVLNLCEITQHGTIDISRYPGGESIDFTFGAGLGKSFRAYQEIRSSGDFEELTAADILKGSEAIGQAVQYCNGSITISGYRNLSMRFTDADDIHRSLMQIATEKCGGQK